MSPAPRTFRVRGWDVELAPTIKATIKDAGGVDEPIELPVDLIIGQEYGPSLNVDVGPAYAAIRRLELAGVSPPRRAAAPQPDMRKRTR